MNFHILIQITTCDSGCRDDGKIRWQCDIWSLRFDEQNRSKNKALMMILIIIFWILLLTLLVMPSQNNEIVHYINKSLMSKTHLQPHNTDHGLLQTYPCSVIEYKNENYISDSDFKIIKPSLQIIKQNNVLAEHKFISEILRKKSLNLTEIPHTLAPLSFKENNPKLIVRANRIVIPSLISSMQKLRKSDSFESQLPEFGEGAKHPNRYTMTKKDSQNSKSTTSSTIRQRLKQINWPKSIRPPESFYSINYF